MQFQAARRPAAYGSGAAAPSLRQTASRCGVPASPSGGIFRCRPSGTAAAPHAVGLRGNDRSLNARQKLLRFEQGQSQVSNIANTFRPADLYQIGAPAAGVIPCRNEPQHLSHARNRSAIDPTDRSSCVVIPSLWTLPHTGAIATARSASRSRTTAARQQRPH